MDPAAERLIDALAGPLADEPEAEALARAELAGRIERGGAGTAVLARARRQVLRAQALRPLWRWLASLAALAGVAGTLGPWLARRAFPEGEWVGEPVAMFGSGPGWFGYDGPGDELERWAQRRLTDDQRLWLLGDTRWSAAADRKRGLWERHPDDPAAMADYLAEWVAGGRSPTEEQLATAARVDPGNAAYLLLAAGGRGERALVQATGGRPRKAGGPGYVRRWEIRDEVALAEGVAMFHRAAQLERWETHDIDLLGRRLALLPAQDDLRAWMLGQAVLPWRATLTNRCASLSRALQAEAERLAAAGDVDGMRRLVASWEALMPRLAAGTRTMADTAWLPWLGWAAGEQLAAECRRLGLAAEAVRVKRATDELLGLGIWVGGPPGNPDPDWHRLEELAARTSGMLVGPYVRIGMPPPAAAELEPWRRAEYAELEQLFLPGLPLLFLFGAAGVLALRRCASRAVRRPGDRAELLLGRRDWLWIIVLGIVLPWGWYLVLVRWGPFHGRGRGLDLDGLWVAIEQPVALTITVVLALGQALRWRLRRAARVLAFGPRRCWPGWLGVGLAGLLVLLPGWAMMDGGPAAWPVPALPPDLAAVVNDFAGDLPRWPVLLAAGLLGLAVLHLLVAAGAVVCGGAGRALERSTAARAAIPALLLASVPASLLLPLARWEERQWVGRDRIMRFDPARPATSVYEWRAAQIARERLGRVVW